MIEINNLKKSFGSFKALDGVNLHVKTGTVTGLVGPNGAGKTTLMRHISGLFKSDDGEVLIDGTSPFENPIVKQKLVFIQDDIASAFGWTIKAMHNFYKGMYPNFDENIYENLGSFLPPIDPGRRVSKLSRGMKKQVAFRLAIAARPQYLLLDEPVDGLDPIVRHQMWSVLMREIESKSLTVLVSSHNLRELEDICDSVAIMKNGRVVLEGECDELRGNIFKIQSAFPGMAPLQPEGLEVLHKKVDGVVAEYVVKGEQEKVIEAFKAFNPSFVQFKPVTLEEIFIYSLGGQKSEIKEIL